MSSNLNLDRLHEGEFSRANKVIAVFADTLRRLQQWDPKVIEQSVNQSIEAANAQTQEAQRVASAAYGGDLSIAFAMMGGVLGLGFGLVTLNGWFQDWKERKRREWKNL